LVPVSPFSSLADGAIAAGASTGRVDSVDGAAGGG
jgi:hypothetical protein